MNLQKLSLCAVTAFLFSAFFMTNTHPAFSAETPREQRQKPLIIDAATQRQLETNAEEAKKAKSLTKIKEEETKIPEVPKAIGREKLGGADEVRLAELEQRRASGRITQTEYDLEKDALARESNINF